MQITKGR